MAAGAESEKPKIHQNNVQWDTGRGFLQKTVLTLFPASSSKNYSVSHKFDFLIRQYLKYSISHTDYIDRAKLQRQKQIAFSIKGSLLSFEVK